jgi:uncharacterized protein (DUF3820 family)
MNEGSIIHSLMTGQPLCQFSSLPPNHWPEGHLWSADKSTVNCSGCLSVLNKPIPAEQLADLPKQVKKNQLNPDRDKREPSYTDTNKMPFGKHRGELLSEVPASYFHWLWGQRPISDKKLENYIHNNINALKQEHPDGIWS